jgi:hypothetical protein
MNWRLVRDACSLLALIGGVASFAYEMGREKNIMQSQSNAIIELKDYTRERFESQRQYFSERMNALNNSQLQLMGQVHNLSLEVNKLNARK